MSGPSACGGAAPQGEALATQTWDTAHSHRPLIGRGAGGWGPRARVTHTADKNSCCRSKP